MGAGRAAGKECVFASGDILSHWMERYQKADPAAPQALVNALSPVLLRIFRLESGSAREAEDLLQETWLRVHRVRHTYRLGEPVLPWVYAIARRVRVDHYRRNRRIVSHEVQMEPLPEAASRNETGMLPEFATLVAALPEGEREVVTLLKAGDMSVAEVARATASTEGAVKQRAHRAYRRLRRLLEKEAPAGRYREPRS